MVCWGALFKAQVSGPVKTQKQNKPKPNKTSWKTFIMICKNSDKG